VLKTVKDSEKALLINPKTGLLEPYFNHMMNVEHSFLSRFYGVYTIRSDNMEDITCFIMDNLLGSDFMNIQRIYDLKGSTIGRIVPLTLEQKAVSSGLKVLKDLNFCELNESLRVNQTEKKSVLEVIKSDSEFLASQSLMDYSLLFIKAKKGDASQGLQVMPAMVRVEQKDGST